MSDTAERLQLQETFTGPAAPWSGPLPFHEYFHGDAGWTAWVIPRIGEWRSWRGFPAGLKNPTA